MSSLNGVLVLDKPANITSRDAVDLACRRLRIREIGHCGTLDPLATGVLVLVVGRARRLQGLFSKSVKTYEATVRLGATSETDDAEGPIHEQSVAAPPPRAAVESQLPPFRGTIEQRPPNYSAIKIEGRRLYDIARSGEPVEAPLRTVRIDEIELLDYEYPRVSLRISCAGGTYVRSIARDLGQALGTGGYLEALTRTASGPFGLSDAVRPDLVEAKDVIALEQALSSFPRIDIAASQSRRLANGAEVYAEHGRRPDDEDAPPLFGWVHGRVAAILKTVSPRKVRSSRMLVTPEELLELADQELANARGDLRPPRYGESSAGY